MTGTKALFLAMLTDEERDVLRILRKEKRPPTTPHHHPSSYGLTEDDAYKARLRYLRDLKNKYTEQAMSYHLETISSSIPDDAMWFTIWQYNEWTVKAKEVSRKIHNLRKYNKNKDIARESFDIPALKLIPITNFVELDVRRTFSLRDEKTPSCHYYENENRWWDFGSDEGGDVIDLIMKLHDCNFIEACKYLSRG